MEIKKLESSLMAPFVRLGQHEEYEWTPLPWDGIFNKVLFFDRTTGLTIELAKVEQGAEFPAHYHPTVQTLFLVSGRLRSGDTIITPGTFNVIPAGQLHGPFFAEEESIQLKSFSATPVYILQDGQSFVYKEDGRVIDTGKMSFPSHLDVQNLLR